ncbi:TerC family protein [Caulobacter sp. KR2-114]|uniref:TerC family protein n=1 Tax=Caulobacter sp. KR2-114 TaxID=3400912 RepID=UPI003C01D4BE
MVEMLPGPLGDHAWIGPATVLVQVLMIDLVLAGDNAVAVGLAAGGLSADQRKKVILVGLAAAVVMRIGFAIVTAQLMAVIGLLLAGGVLLLWVCWKMWRDLRSQSAHEDAAELKPAKTFRAAFVQILIADLSMSLDNVLAVAGAAHNHPLLLAIGLLVSVALMGLAANAIAQLLNRHRWIGYVGLGIVLYVAVHMIWQGYRTVIIDTHQVAQYNAWAPDWADIHPQEISRRTGQHI